MKITIKDIAKKANVSTATVSKILNNKDERISKGTRERVLIIAKENNYIPNLMARSLVTRKTNTIGLVLPDITNPFFPELARGAEDKANKEGYMIMYCNTDDDAEKESIYLEMLAQKMVDGIILTQSANKEGNIESLNKLKIPLVLIDRDINVKNIKGKVLVDNFLGAYEAVDYLIKKGYKKIAYITGPLSTTTAIERLGGYTKALEDAGMLINLELIFEGEYKAQWGIDGTNELLSSKVEFDAIFCGNDLIAVNAIRTLKEKGIRVPNDVGVLGYDNIFLSDMIDPPLTTVNQPAYEMGYEAVKLLIDVLDNNKEGKTIKLKTNLIIRKSV